ncbi:MAG: hypothetical protein NZ529_06685 [Cytophagaceae bacterium]|nr:hypothetical protein [Cytophagaceae bacterium]MDW8456466.1 hypothetical protein [Cytophagaceae bacterium]
MLRSDLKTYSILISFCIIFVSCRDLKKNDVIGPKLEVSPNFKLLEPFSFNLSIADFQNYDTVWFNALFSEKAYWKINLRGLNSGAQTSFSGYSEKLNASSARWYGKSKPPIKFETSERVVAELEIRGHETKYYDTITKITNFRLDGAGNSLVNDFSFYDYGASEFFFLINTDWSEHPDMPLQKISLDVSTSAPAMSYLGSIKYLAKERNPSKPYYLLQDQNYDPKEVYLNLYVLGYGNGNNYIQFNLLEDDNNDQKFEGNKFDDFYIYDLKLDWIGWKLVSIPYSSFLKSGKGNGVQNPKSLMGVEVIFHNKWFPATTDHYNTSISFIIISPDGPLSEFSKN